MQCEADFQTKFTRWAKNNFKDTAVFELKFSKTLSIPFSAVKDHQIANLLSAKHRQISYKIPDVGYDQKPFDCFCIARAKAYVVLMYYNSKNKKEFYMFDIDEFVHLKETHHRKSLTLEEAQSLASFTGILA